MTRGSVAELYKLGVDSLAPALAGCYKVLCETGSLPQALKDGEITRLRKTKGTGENAAEHYRNISILEHRGKALVGAQLQPLMRTLQSNLDACQFREVVRRSTRDAIALADEILRRYRLHRRRQRLARRARVGQQPSQPCLAMTLFDLNKAFDLLVRADAWKAVGRLAQDASIEFFLEEQHRGVFYILKDKHTGQLRKRILTDMGVRQDSVEGPACFLALYDIATWEVKTAGDRTAITAQQQEIGTEVNVSDLKYMDDLVSCVEFRDLDTLQRFIECVTAVFIQHSFQVNVGKLEVCVLWLQVKGPRLEWHS